MNERYVYGMKMRGIAPGTCPKDGLVHWEDAGEDTRHSHLGYYSLLWYDHPLTDKQVSDYELEYIGREENGHGMDL